MGSKGSARGFAGNIEQPRGRFSDQRDGSPAVQQRRQSDERFSARRGRFARRQAQDHRRPQQLVETAAWSVLGRAPDDEEAKLLDEYPIGRRDDRKLEACRQLVGPC